MRQLAELRRRLVAAEDPLSNTLAAMKREEAFDAASDRFSAAESALDAGPRGTRPSAPGAVRGPAGAPAGQHRAGRQ